tara:strand:- start:803 stop:1057 length:255 start_codon:yes stop_codon:yes gene_type:complete
LIALNNARIQNQRFGKKFGCAPDQEKERHAKEAGCDQKSLRHTQAEEPHSTMKPTSRRMIKPKLAVEQQPEHDCLTPPVVRDFA